VRPIVARMSPRDPAVNAKTAILDVTLVEAMNVLKGGEEEEANAPWQALSTWPIPFVCNAAYNAVAVHGSAQHLLYHLIAREMSSHSKKAVASDAKFIAIPYPGSSGINLCFFCVKALV
jgi:hypothetical protein